jgi:GTP-binding protein
MEIKTATFIISNTDLRKCPQDSRTEFAFIGRSNVGKSSLINMLCNQNKLAMTSATPGKTQLINHFLINNEWYLVDLPGYGYAKIGKQAKENLKKIIESYILYRENLTSIFVLIDCRLEPQPIDLEFIRWLGKEGVPFAIVFTKADKLSTAKLNAGIETYKNKLLEEWEELPPIFVTSAETRAGKEDVLNYIETIVNG